MAVNNIDGINMDLKALGLSKKLSSFLSENGIKEPTDVQRTTIPVFLEGKSPLVVAQTGSGKTFSFAWPILEIAKAEEEKNGVETRPGRPKVVILAPTRELSVQLSKVIKSICHHIRLRVKLIVGGDKRGRDIPLEQSCFEILIGSPEKIEEQIQRGKIHLEDVQVLVLDEVDLLMDMGFNLSIGRLYRKMKTKSLQVGLFCATFPSDLEEKVNEIFTETSFEKIMIDGAHKIVNKVQTSNIEMDSKHKMAALREFLDEHKETQGIVFFNTKSWLEKSYLYLQNKKCSVGVGLIHGERTALERKSDMQKFISKTYRVLFATDVAARGIDIENISWVLNFDLPLRTDDYLHRTGRTARIGRSGKVINFVTPSDIGLITKIDKAIRKQKEVVLDPIDKQRQRSKGKE